MRGLNDIHFHDSRLVRVVEVCERDELLFYVRYPVDWEKSLYEPRVIAFLDVLEYRVDEVAFGSPKELLEASVVGDAVNGRWLVVIETSAGERRLWATGVELRELREGGSEGVREEAR